MVNEFCGFKNGVIEKKLPADSTLNNMKKSDLIKLLHIAQHNYESLAWFYNNAANVNMKYLQALTPTGEIKKETRIINGHETHLFFDTDRQAYLVSSDVMEIFLDSIQKQEGES